MITSNIAGIFGTSKAEVRSVLEVRSSSETTPKRWPGLIGIASVALATALTETALSAPITWIGGNDPWDAVSIGKWSPADEPDSDDEAIFNTANTVDLANAAEDVLALTLSNGIDLDTNGNDLNADGLIQLVDASTNLYVGPATSVLSGDNITINTGATLRPTGGTVIMAEAVGAGSFLINDAASLIGNGTIALNDGGVAAGTVVLTVNGGTLTATSTAVGDLFGNSAATLAINVNDVNARIDLDNGLSPLVSVSRNDTLDINGEAHGTTDSFSGVLNLGDGSVFDMSNGWQIDTGTINVNTGGILVGSAGSPATIAGGLLTFAGGTINLDDIDSLRLSAPFTTTAGTIANAGHILFNANGTIGAGTDFQMTGANASLTVEPGVIVNIDDADFNPDGTGTSTNIITVNAGGSLDIDLGAAPDESFTGVINLNGGELDVTTTDNGWAIDGIVNAGTGTGISSINGEELTLTSATLTANNGATLDINASSVWNASGNLVVNAGGIARIDGTSEFNTAGTFTGAGTLHIGGTATFTTATTINMPSGTVDLDGADLVGNTVTVNANTTINANTMASFGNSNFAGTNILVINNFAGLTVNLTNPASEWTLNSTATLDINAPADPFAGGGIGGSDFNMNGTANISGNSIWTARTDITGTANVAAAGSLNLRGGTLVDTNRLLGGTIAGPGAVQALTNDALFGFGTISAEVRFDDNSELRADGGILTVSGLISDVGVIGTADDDGILNVTNAWNTNVAGSVNLQGGELRGATVTTGTGGITGDGFVSAPLINSTFVHAENGGTLRLETAANNNDWDGAGSGLLQASSGDLELWDNSVFGFVGDVFVNIGRQVHTIGFELDFNPGSTLSLRGGTYRCTNSTDFGGTTTVILAGQSVLQITGTANFENGSTTTLNDNLRLNNTLTTIQAGADFTGSGALINPATRALRLIDGVVSTDFNVLIQNEGVMQLGGAGTDGQAQGGDYQQTATGSLQIDLGGVALNAFDRLNLTGAASLSGALNLSLIGGYVPVAGHTFNILTATGGISGTFTTVTQPAGMPAGLALAVSYSAFIVQLTVVAQTPYEIWINSFGSITNPADRLKGANPDNDALNNQAEFALDGNPASGAGDGKVVGKIAPVGGINAMTLTLPVRTGTILDPGDPAGGELGMIKVADAVSYRIQASDELTNWTLTVGEVGGGDAAAIQAGLPALNVGWVYRSFRSPGAVAGDPAEFMRIFIGE
ncbi:MAG: hypothetical protein V4819_23390 [Verrucomicrobiota bacterium]